MHKWFLPDFQPMRVSEKPVFSAKSSFTSLHLRSAVHGSRRRKEVVSAKAVVLFDFKTTKFFGTEEATLIRSGRAGTLHALVEAGGGSQGDVVYLG
jgi:hypothetical protein